jgi:hypothetical protein
LTDFTLVRLQIEVNKVDVGSQVSCDHKWSTTHSANIFSDLFVNVEIVKIEFFIWSKRVFAFFAAKGS